ncbi:DEAD-like helicase [Cotonvirus japonicus]|uniref:DEAD-like helicase n=1 Tax=Cotonvirus japonicus TaxID=2811091 RepID=A0ABM7NT99_9VIRU|nr:DEAD-like helicase [Cotonvirus japonicus]BCS83405.1 DEAD-like helicase [Cotonvirus japonicus]
MSKYNFLKNIPNNVNKNDYHHKDNVIECATKIMKKFRKNYEIVTVAEMQSGKTEVMKRLIYLINNFNDKLRNLGINISKSNVYVVICASSVNLKSQHKIKLPEIKNNIFHLNDLNSIIKNTYENKDLLTIMSDSSLIIFDECHCDIECEKTIDKFRKLLKSYSKNNSSSYYKIGFSATPYEHIVSGIPCVVMKPGPGYYGIGSMFELSSSSKKKPVLFQAKNLTLKSEIKSLFTEINVYKAYYIFRLPNKISQSDEMIINIVDEFKLQGFKVSTFVYDMEYKASINDLLNIEPTIPTIIFIKDKLRIGEYLNTEHVYLVHDDPNNQYAHTTVQSLLGRCCGYGKKNHETIIYCDYDKAWEHYKWTIKNYNINSVPKSAKYVTKNKQIKYTCIF